MLNLFIHFFSRGNTPFFVPNKHPEFRPSTCDQPPIVRSYGHHPGLHTAADDSFSHKWRRPRRPRRPLGCQLWWCIAHDHAACRLSSSLRTWKLHGMTRTGDLFSSSWWPFPVCHNDVNPVLKNQEFLKCRYKWYILSLSFTVFWCRELLVAATEPRTYDHLANLGVWTVHSDCR